MTQRTTLAALRRSIPLLAISLAFFACSDGNDSGADSETIKNSLLLNFTSDYETGELRWMDTDSASLSASALPFGQDSKVFASGNNVFVLDRISSNIACMQSDKIGDPNLIAQKALEQGANPYEIAVSGNMGYIVFNSADYVQTFNVNTCTPGEKIDLSITQANASSIKISGDTLLVLLQRLVNFSATEPGLLVRIKADTKAVIDTIQLKFYNPNSSILSNGKLYVSSQRYDENFAVDLEKSGIEVVDLKTGTSDTIASGTRLGGGGNGMALDESNHILYASVYAGWGDVPVKSINLNSKAIAPLSGITDSFGGLVFDSETGRLFIADTDVLKIYNTANGSVTQVTSRGKAALPPYSLAIARW
ncbi:MAG: hypothetical protein LBQ87_06930 [Candidatus Fibromonas sp.]|jgi:hypothetical protein|nr:hypothetical protein [Candidatus Fibromonas sp.]